MALLCTHSGFSHGYKSSVTFVTFSPFHCNHAAFRRSHQCDDMFVCGVYEYAAMHSTFNCFSRRGQVCSYAAADTPCSCMDSSCNCRTTATIISRIWDGTWELHHPLIAIAMYAAELHAGIWYLAPPPNHFMHGDNDNFDE